MRRIELVHPGQEQRSTVDRQLPILDEIFLDHVGHFVRDPHAAGRALARAGFAPTPESIQVVPGSEGTPRPTGTGNVTAMFSRGYIEVLFKTADTLLGRELDAALTRHGGVHLAAFAVADGAVALTSVIIVVGDVNEATQRFARFTGREALPSPLGQTIELDRGRVQVMTAEAFTRTLPDVPIPSLPFIGAYAIRVASLAVTSDLLKDAALRTRRSEQALAAIFPEELGPGAWLFTE